MIQLTPGISVDVKRLWTSLRPEAIISSIHGLGISSDREDTLISICRHSGPFSPKLVDRKLQWYHSSERDISRIVPSCTVLPAFYMQELTSRLHQFDAGKMVSTLFKCLFIQYRMTCESVKHRGSSKLKQEFKLVITLVINLAKRTAQSSSNLVTFWTLKGDTRVLDTINQECLLPPLSSTRYISTAYATFDASQNP